MGLFILLLLLLWSHPFRVRTLDSPPPGSGHGSVRYFDYPEEITCTPSGVVVRIRNDSFQGMFIRLSIVDNYGIPRDLHSLPSSCPYTTVPQADGSLLFTTPYKGCYVHLMNNTVSLELRIDGIDESKRIIVIERIPLNCTLPSLPSVTVGPTKGTLPITKEPEDTTTASTPVVDTTAVTPITKEPANVTTSITTKELVDVTAVTHSTTKPVDTTEEPANATVPTMEPVGSTVLTLPTKKPVDATVSITTKKPVDDAAVTHSITEPVNETIPITKEPVDVTAVTLSTTVSVDTTRELVNVTVPTLEPARSTVVTLPITKEPVDTTSATIPVVETTAVTLPITKEPVDGTAVTPTKEPVNATVSITKEPVGSTVTLSITKEPVDTSSATIPVVDITAVTLPITKVPVDVVAVTHSTPQPVDTTEEPVNATVPTTKEPVGSTVVTLPTTKKPVNATVTITKKPVDGTAVSPTKEPINATVLITKEPVDVTAVTLSTTEPVDTPEEPVNVTVPTTKEPVGSTVVTLPITKEPVDATSNISVDTTAATLSITKEPVDVTVVTPTTKQPVTLTVVTLSLTEEPMNTTAVTIPVVDATTVTLSATKKPVDVTLVTLSTKEPVVTTTTVTGTKVPVNRTVATPHTTEPVDATTVTLSSTKEPIDTTAAIPIVDTTAVTLITGTMNVTAPTKEPIDSTAETAPITKEPVNRTTVTPSSKEPVDTTAATLFTKEPVNVTIPISKEPVDATTTTALVGQTAGFTTATISMDLTSNGDKTHICDVDAKDRVNCGNASIGEEECYAKGCCYDLLSGQIPCFYGKTAYIDCTTNGLFTIVVPRIATVPPLNLDSVSLLNNTSPQCGPITRTTEFVLFRFPLDSCGTTQIVDGLYITYSVDVMAKRKIQTGPRGSITRESTFKLHVKCHFTGKKDIPLTLVVNTASLPPFVLREGVLQMEMRIAKEKSYSTWFADEDYPLVRFLKEPVYIEVRLLHRTDPNIELVLNDCWATQTLDPHRAPRWSILLHGCPYYRDNYLTQLHAVEAASDVPFPTHHKRFEVKTFAFWNRQSRTALSGEVYFHCSATVCLLPDMQECATTCGAGRRIARHSDVNISAEASYHGLVTLKRPIVFTLAEGKTADLSQANVNTTDGVLLAAAVTSLVLALICGLVLCWNCKQMPIS
ncbi:mucin-2-like [Chiloscyllium plagiosum]|uniref:mucin-2-like n=1 Tax=Chiloscyllium plagiosum TaxID=36176 RepID=UPI001CB85A04|nr:mucin-2-like [Chiloscyllium plagiosum]